MDTYFEINYIDYLVGGVRKSVISHTKGRTIRTILDLRKRHCEIASVFMCSGDRRCEMYIWGITAEELSKNFDIEIKTIKAFWNPATKKFNVRHAKHNANGDTMVLEYFVSTRPYKELYDEWVKKIHEYEQLFDGMFNYKINIETLPDDEKGVSMYFKIENENPNRFSEIELAIYPEEN